MVARFDDGRAVGGEGDGEALTGQVVAQDGDGVALVADLHGPGRRRPGRQGVDGQDLGQVQVKEQAAAYGAAGGELGTAIVGGLERGGQAVVGYGHAVANDPLRVVGDVQDAAEAGYDATAGFVEGQVQRHQGAFARGKGWETLGMSTGQVATYVVPIGGGPVRGLAQAGACAAVRDGAQLATRETAEAVGRMALNGADDVAGAAARVAPQATRADIDALRARLSVPDTETGEPIFSDVNEVDADTLDLLDEQLGELA